MDTSEYDRLRARTDALQIEVDAMLEGYQERMESIAEARDKLAVATTQAWSSDNLVRVTSNAAGVPIEVWVDPQAYKRLTPQKLGASVTEASQAAARGAKAQIAEALQPITAETEFVLENPLDDSDIPGTPVGVESILPPPPAPREPQEQPGYGQAAQPSFDAVPPPQPGRAQPPSYSQQPGSGQPASMHQPPRQPKTKPSYAPAWEQDEDDTPHWKGW
ncbi:YbaB/EbfC family nucleoid-associated protein [Nocardia miyunensis]|uniref:YbaB/EbfC family nucleoid-associated protein n=1 Tax=Nocardia miyunensis TaxID=282684 RepID=UPI00082EC0C9|nr:YbaB/EbfC family nucleoid-associated protein [Nocardia miyunensis]